MSYYKSMGRTFHTTIFGAFLTLSVLGASFAQAQSPGLPGETQAALPSSALPGSNPGLPPGPDQAFSFDDEAFDIEQSADDAKQETRKKAFDAALEGLLPLKPEEIRALLERFDRTQESVELPVYPAPKPEVVVQNIELDPGAAPAVIKMAYGHVTTVTFLDTSGAPWPIQDMSWAGNFEVVQTEQDPEKFTHKFRISPQSEFAYGNASIDLLGLMTPVIITLETSRDSVHYRFDAIIDDYGPLAKTPLINAGGVSTSAGNTDTSAMLRGTPPDGALRLSVSGVDGRTSAYRYNGMVYLRTPLTLLSPGWNSSVASADGTRVYEIEDSPVVLLSDRGHMVKAKLTERGDLLDE